MNLRVKGARPPPFLHVPLALDGGGERRRALMSRRVMAQVSCELVAPKESRPNEGVLFFNVELSPLASPAFEAGR